MKHWYCEEMVTGETFLVSAETWGEACDTAEEVAADYFCDDENELDVYVDPEPLTENEAEATGLDEY